MDWCASLYLSADEVLDACKNLWQFHKRDIANRSNLKQHGATHGPQDCFLRDSLIENRLSLLLAFPSSQGVFRLPNNLDTARTTLFPIRRLRIADRGTRLRVVRI